MSGELVFLSGGGERWGREGGRDDVWLVATCGDHGVCACVHVWLCIIVYNVL